MKGSGHDLISGSCKTLISTTLPRSLPWLKVYSSVDISINYY
jgi:hypothetical protein